jgi:Divergent InlB B-repeat domain
MTRPISEARLPPRICRFLQGSWALLRQPRQVRRDWTVTKTVTRTLTLLVVGAVTILANFTDAYADSPLVWSAPTKIDLSSEYLSGVSCIASTTCIAVDHAGGIFKSAGSTSEAPWSLQSFPLVEPAAVSCVTAQFCVIANRDGSVLYSEDAAAPTPSWVLEEHADHSGSPLSAISCVSTTFCVAADEAGNILTSTNPTGGSGTWVSVPVDKAGRTSRAIAIYGVACPTETLCVASDGAGRILTSTHPTGGKAAWQVRSAEANVTIWGISCSSATLCVAVDGGGNVLVSTDPIAEAWTVNYRVDTHPLEGVSCVAPATCVAIDEAGNVVMSSAAASGVSGWTVANVDGGARQLTGVSCESSQRCVVVDSQGNVLIGASAPSRTLSVSLSGTGFGSVTGGGISCPGACSALAPNGSTVTLIAAPSAGSTFIGWSGACTGSGPCQIVMSSDYSVTAEYAARPLAAGGGGGNRGGVPPATNPTVAGAVISLAAGVAIPLHCWAKSDSCLPVSLTLTAVESFGGKHLVAVSAGHNSVSMRKKVLVGATTVAIRAGETITARVLLNRVGRSLLRARHRFSARLAITATSTTVLWKQTVGLFQRAKTKHS